VGKMPMCTDCNGQSETVPWYITQDDYQFCTDHMPHRAAHTQHPPLSAQLLTRVSSCAGRHPALCALPASMGMAKRDARALQLSSAAKSAMKLHPRSRLRAAVRCIAPVKLRTAAQAENMGGAAARNAARAAAARRRQRSRWARPATRAAGPSYAPCSGTRGRAPPA